MTGAPLSPALVPDDAAAEWFALKRSGAMTAQQLIEFQAWLDASPDHRAAYHDAEQSWAMAGALREEPELLLLRSQARGAFPPFRRPLLAGSAAAAAVAVVFGGLAATQAIPVGGVPLIHGKQQQVFRTGVGQRTTITLSDGSEVTLDTDTVLRTNDAGRERRMYLDQGRAFFRVAKDPTRPFIVDAAGRRVTALGTAFEVQVGPKQFEVTLVEGKVRVEQPRAMLRPAQSADLKAGFRVEARNQRDWKVEPADVVKETGWVEGRLTFIDDPLVDVAAELSRYSDKKIVLKDPEVGRERVVAVFKPGDLESFVKMVRNYQLAEVRETETTIELSAIEPSQ
jgi:transmembrane sensor